MAYSPSGKQSTLTDLLPSYVQKKTNGNVSYYESNLFNKGQGYLKCSKCKGLYLLTFMDIGNKEKEIDDYLALHTHLTEIVYKTVYVQGPEPKKVEVPKTLKQSQGRKFR